MRVRRHGRPLLWLLLPTLLAQGVIATTSAEDSHLSSLARRATDATEYDELALAGSSKPPTDTPNRDIGTKDAPVDGRDGKPHAGPWVGKDAPDSTNGKKKKKPAAGGTDEKVPAAVSRLEKEGYADAVADDGVVPEKNDGVMDDPARKAPEQGTTGTEGGVSERNKKQKMKEEKTGEKSERKPKAPKEAPPLPHSEEEKIKESNAKSGKDVVGEEVVPEKPKGAQGLERPAHLPETPKGRAEKDRSGTPPKAGKYLVDTMPFTEGKKRPQQKAPPASSDSGSTSSSSPSSSETDEGLIQPLHSFVLALVMILFSEVGDKTFLVAALMAMRHDRLVVFSAAFSALIAMTVLSAVLGHTVPSLLPRRFVALSAAGLFLVFGAKMLREGLAMPKDSGVGEEMREVEAELEEKEANIAREGGRGRSASLSAVALEAGRARAATLAGRNPPALQRAASPISEGSSPSSSPSRRLNATSASASAPPSGLLAGMATGVNNLCSLVLSPAWVQTFVMTFLGEWGDRSQIATIAMAAGQDYWWVTGGAVCGHAVCTGVAVIGGRALAGRVSMRVVTIGGALAFLVFGVIYFIESFYI